MMSLDAASKAAAVDDSSSASVKVRVLEVVVKPAQILPALLVAEH